MSSQNIINNIKNQYPELSEQLDELDNTYNMMLRKINHEFGNAVTLVYSSLQIIESSHPEVKDFKYWNSTKTDVRHMVNMVSEITSFNHCKVIKEDNVDIDALLHSILSSFSISPIYSHIKYTYNNTAHHSVISGDSVKLRQAFINLIKNASEAITPTQNGRINISLSSKNNVITIVITDNGCGITDEQLKEIFLPLVSYKKNGSGLGLPICKRIIDAHNGSLSVSSIPGTGTSMSVTLRMQKSDQEA